jgi:hypothetical protein
MVAASMRMQTPTHEINETSANRASAANCGQMVLVKVGLRSVQHVSSGQR